MLPNQYGRKQYALEVVAILAIGGVLVSITVFMAGAQQGSKLWMAMGYFLGMASMLVVAIYFASSKSWHSTVQSRIEYDASHEKPKVRA